MRVANSIEATFQLGSLFPTEIRASTPVQRAYVVYEGGRSAGQRDVAGTERGKQVERTRAVRHTRLIRVTVPPVESDTNASLSSLYPIVGSRSGEGSAGAK